MKKCVRCGKTKPDSEFYLDRTRGGRTARCRDCHGLADRKCVVCSSIFVGGPKQKLCSPECRSKYRPQTFMNCVQCGIRFGPLPRLNRQFCSYACKVAAQATGSKFVWKPTPEAKHANTQVRNALRRGDLVRAIACEECGRKCKTQGAHADYSRPLDVRWLCIPCHLKWDKALPKGGAIRFDRTDQPSLSRKGKSLSDVHKARLRAAWVERKRRASVSKADGRTFAEVAEARAATEAQKGPHRTAAGASGPE